MLVAVLSRLLLWTSDFFSGRRRTSDVRKMRWLSNNWGFWYQSDVYPAAAVRIFKNQRRLSWSCLGWFFILKNAMLLWSGASSSLLMCIVNWITWNFQVGSASTMKSPNLELWSAVRFRNVGQLCVRHHCRSCSYVMMTQTDHVESTVLSTRSHVIRKNMFATCKLLVAMATNLHVIPNIRDQYGIFWFIQ